MDVCVVSPASREKNGPEIRATPCANSRAHSDSCGRGRATPGTALGRRHRLHRGVARPRCVPTPARWAAQTAAQLVTAAAPAIAATRSAAFRIKPLTSAVSGLRPGCS
jgi:hypothetical protein